MTIINERYLLVLSDGRYGAFMSAASAKNWGEFECNRDKNLTYKVFHLVEL